MNLKFKLENLDQRFNKLDETKIYLVLAFPYVNTSPYVKKSIGRCCIIIGTSFNLYPLKPEKASKVKWENLILYNGASF